MERDDLRVVLHSVPEGTTSHWCTACSGTRTVTDADLASLGYVKLDGIDVDKLGEVVHDSLLTRTGNAPTLGSLRVAEDVLAYLAAVDQEAP